MDLATTWGVYYRVMKPYIGKLNPSVLRRFRNKSIALSNRSLFAAAFESSGHNNLIRSKHLSGRKAIRNVKRTSRGGQWERRKKRKALCPTSSCLSSLLQYRRVVDYPQGDSKQSKYSREFRTVCFRQLKGHTTGIRGNEGFPTIPNERSYNSLCSSADTCERHEGCCFCFRSLFGAYTDQSRKTSL